MFSIQSYSTFLYFLFKTGTVLLPNALAGIKACDMFFLFHDQILYRNKIKSPE
jgi:hypothetical protein